MRSRRHVTPALVAVAVGAAALTACDTNDGKAMKDPTDAQLLRSSQTSTLPLNPSPTLAGPLFTRTPIGGEPIGADSLPGEAAAVGSGSPLGSDGPATSAVTTSVTSTAGFSVTAPWADGAPILNDYTCAGAGTRPVITWTAPPAGTVEIAVIVGRNSDAPDAFVNWAVTGLPPAAGSVGDTPELATGVEAVNSAGTAGWTPLCPTGATPSEYQVTVVALTAPLNLPTDPTAADVLTALQASTSTATSITGVAAA